MWHVALLFDNGCYLRHGWGIMRHIELWEGSTYPCPGSLFMYTYPHSLSPEALVTYFTVKPTLNLNGGQAKLWLTHWGRVTHICVSKIAIIGSDNGLSPGRRQAIIGTNAGILLIGPLGTDLSEILIEIHIFLFKKISSAKCRPFCLGLNVLTLTV